jgi:hypothetical protein
VFEFLTGTERTEMGEAVNEETVGITVEFGAIIFVGDGIDEFGSSGIGLRSISLKMFMLVLLFEIDRFENKLMEDILGSCLVKTSNAISWSNSTYGKSVFSNSGQIDVDIQIDSKKIKRFGSNKT